MFIALVMLVGFIQFLRTSLDRPELRPPTLVLFSVGLFLWLVLAPVDLYSRFFLSILPVFAIGVAVVFTERLGWTGTGLLTVAMIVSVVGHPPEDGSQNHSRELAGFLDEVADDGGSPCALGFVGFSLLPYRPTTELVIDVVSLDQCTLAVTYAGWFEAELSQSRLDRIESLSPNSQYKVAWSGDDLDSDDLDSNVRSLQQQLALKEQPTP